MKLFEEGIKYLPVDKLDVNKFNPNKMPGVIYDRLKASVNKFGVLAPILVRVKGDRYEIIDGEWRSKVSKELGLSEIIAKVVEATDEEVKQLILATTIKGKHDPYEVLDIVREISDEDDNELLRACNLDKAKVKRQLGYAGAEGSTVVKRKRDENRGTPIRDEKDLPAVRSVEGYKAFLIIPLDPEDYIKVTSKLESLDGNISKAMVKLCSTNT